MMHILFAFSVLLQQEPSNVSAPPELTFVDPAEIRLTHSTVAMFTHCSRRFDPLGQTQTAVRRTAATVKTAGFPILYLHDRHNPDNPPEKYLYDDWQPTAFLRSDIGHFEMDLTAVNHVIVLGGFYGQCERATVSDAIRLWYRARVPHDLRLTQVIDGTFSVGQHIDSDDPYAKRIRAFHSELKSQHPDAVLTVEQIISRIDDADLVVDFLQRQHPSVPLDINIVMDVSGRITPVQVVDPEAPVLTFAYRTSDSLLRFEKPVVDWKKPVRRIAKRRQPTLEFFELQPNRID
ncbi:MAG: hypothetical protein R3C59_28585 [Planctomycetaceae bacterium]